MKSNQVGSRLIWPSACWHPPREAVGASKHKQRSSIIWPPFICPFRKKNSSCSCLTSSGISLHLSPSHSSLSHSLSLIISHSLSLSPTCSHPLPLSHSLSLSFSLLHYFSLTHVRAGGWRLEGCRGDSWGLPVLQLACGAPSCLCSCEPGGTRSEVWWRGQTTHSLLKVANRSGCSST